MEYTQFMNSVSALVILRMDLHFLDNLCFFQTLGRINNHITEESLYYEKGPAIILKNMGVNIAQFEKKYNRYYVVIIFF